MQVDAAPNGGQGTVSSGRQGLENLRAQVDGFVDRLYEAFGTDFLRFLAFNYLGLKGVLYLLINSATLPFFQYMKASSTEYQLANMIAMVPWSMKGFIGVLSDIVPIGRYHKRGYLYIASFCGFVGLAVLSAVPLGHLVQAGVWQVATVFGLVNTMISIFDLLCEGKYSEVMRERGAGSEVLTVVWSCVNIGSLVACAAVAVSMSDAFEAQRLLMACLPLAVLAGWRTWKGDLPEDPARSWNSLFQKAMSEPRLFLLAFAMVLGTSMTAVASALLDKHQRSLMAVLCSIVLLVCGFRALPWAMARSNLYLFLISVAYVDISGPLTFFYTGKANCVADGPAFSYSYYLAVGSAVGSVGAVLGAVLFQKMQALQFRTAFVITTLIQVLASACDLIIVMRLNVQVGISDKAAYLFGDAACQAIAGQMATMPMALLTARLCPRGAEATVFAILAGFQNFGGAVSTVLGSYLSDMMGVSATSVHGPCNFEQLPVLIVLGHMVAPVLCIPFTWWLVPAAAINDEQALMALSPPPSFMSPAPSPPGTPVHRPCPTSPSFDDGDGEYVLMQEEHDVDSPNRVVLSRSVFH